jgi:hypothetical protein
LAHRQYGINERYLLMRTAHPIKQLVQVRAMGGKDVLMSQQTPEESEYRIKNKME